MKNEKLMKSENADLISINAASRAIGITVSTLWKQVQSGAIRSYDGKVVLSEVVEDRAANVNSLKARGRGSQRLAQVQPPAKRGRGRSRDERPVREAKTRAKAPSDEKPNGQANRFSAFSEAQARRESAVADMRQLEYAQKAGRLIERAEHERTVFDTARAFRDALLAWPARTVEILAAEAGADPSLLGPALADHVRDFLAELAGTDADGIAA